MYDASVDGHVSTRAVNARPKMEIFAVSVCTSDDDEYPIEFRDSALI